MNWSKSDARKRMLSHGIEHKARRSKDTLRREADRLLAGYSGPVTKVPAGSRVIGSQVSADRRQKRLTGNASSEAGARLSRAPESTTQKAQKPKGYRPQGDLFITASKSDPASNAFSRSVPPGLVVYCDGACEPNPGIGGWGFVVYRDAVEIDFGCGGAEETTNQRMELKAAIEALICVRNIGEKHFRLFSDSQYVVKGCNEWRHTWKRNGWSKRKPNSSKRAEGEIKNLELWKDLDRALTELPITLEWCKGHAGIIGNERADELSQEGREAIQALQPDPLALIREQLDYSTRF